MNFDAKIRRESTDLKDLFTAHIGAMDSMARGLRNAAEIVRDGILDKHLKVRKGWAIASWNIYEASGASQLAIEMSITVSIFDSFSKLVYSSSIAVEFIQVCI